MVFNLDRQLSSWVLIIIIGWLAIVSFFLIRLVRHYNRLIRGTSRGTLKEVLEKILKDAEASGGEIGELFKRIDKQEKDGLLHVQKTGLLRFNPFDEVGGDQSFILVLLDGKDDGIVLTALTSRTGTRWYGKTVEKGEGVEHELSKEEKEAIKKAKDRQKES